MVMRGRRRNQNRRGGGGREGGGRQEESEGVGGAYGRVNDLPPKKCCVARTMPFLPSKAVQWLYGEG
jgi:hypothetical protein